MRGWCGNGEGAAWVGVAQLAIAGRECDEFFLEAVPRFWQEVLIALLVAQYDDWDYLEGQCRLYRVSVTLWD